jgi:hypothetical protein
VDGVTPLVEAGHHRLPRVQSRRYHVTYCRTYP